MSFWMNRFGFPMRGCFLDAGDAGAGGGGGSGEDGGKKGAGANDKNAGGGDSSKNQPFAIFPDEASFSARIKREGRAQLEAVAKELGFESVEAMQAAAKAKKEADDESKSELEKEKAARERAEAEGKSALAKANERLINAEIKIAAQISGFVDPGDAVALVDRTNVQVDDAGNITGAKEAVEALAKAKPHLIGKGSKSSVGSGSNPGSGDPPDPVAAAKKLAEERNKKPAAQGGYDPWARK
jgi:hypothetical protein